MKMTAQRVWDRLNIAFWFAEYAGDYQRADAILAAMTIVETARGPICCVAHQREYGANNTTNTGEDGYLPALS